MTHKKHSSVTPVQLIALGFLIMMLLGTGLLLLPISQRHPGSLSIVDAAIHHGVDGCRYGEYL